MTKAVMTQTIEKPRLSVKEQTLAAILAIVGAVALPQIFHLFGAASGLGTSLGEAFLPMHIMIILAGLLAGPYAGAISGMFGPVVSFALSGMPSAVMLPFMIIELCSYGLFAGLLRSVKIPTIGKVFVTQIAGRAVRAVAILAAVYIFGMKGISASIIWTSITAGLFGLALQWTMIPLIVYRVEAGMKHES